jgi:hypothetical protein
VTIDWILGLLTPLRTIGNHSAITKLHTLQIITAPAKPFPACCVFNSRSLATTSNSGGFSVSALRFYCHSRPCRTLVNCQLFLASLDELNHTADPQLTRCHLYSIIWSPRYITSGRTQQKTPFFYCCVLVRSRGKVFTGRYQETGVCWYAYCIAMTVHATI